MSTAARYTNGIGPINEGTDNTDRIRNNQFLQPVFAASIALSVFAAFTLIQPAVLTGVVTFTVNVGDANNGPYVGDRIQFLLTPDGTTRVVTFGTGFLPTATLSVTTAKYATISFVFNGTSWIEEGRAVTA